MSSESKDNAEDELASWKRERERRKRERQKQRQQDGSGNKDDFDFLAQGMVELDEASNNGNDDEVPFVPLAKRKRLEKEVLIGGMAHRRRHIGLVNTEDENGSGADTNHNHGTEAGGSENNEDSNQVSDGDDEGTTSDPKKVESLLESASALQESLTEEERAEKLRKEEEARILKEASKVQTNALQAASELAKGIQYTSPMPSTWTCPRYIIEQGEESWEKIRKEWHMEVEGVDVPPPCKRFVDMKFAPPILEVLKRKGIKKPTPIQMQGLTVVRIMIQKQFSTIVVCFAHIVMFTISHSYCCIVLYKKISAMASGTGRARSDRDCFHRIRKDTNVWITFGDNSIRRRITYATSSRRRTCRDNFSAISRTGPANLRGGHGILRRDFENPRISRASDTANYRRGVCQRSTNDITNTRYSFGHSNTR